MAHHETITLDGHSLTIEDLCAIAGGASANAAEPALGRVDAARKLVEDIVEKDEPVYGINTGFGEFASVSIDRDKTHELQRNLILSHCAGVGDPLPREVSRAMLALRLNCVLKGHSGMRREVLERMLLHLNESGEPVIPCRGSVGASGDLAPLAHMSLPLLGGGQVFGSDGQPMPTEIWLGAKDLKPLTLEAKEGIALINGTQAITGMLALSLQRLRRVFLQLEAVTALTLEALMGTRRAFFPGLHQVRGHAGQMATAQRLRTLLGEESEIASAHEDCGKVQDAYSLRCVPQVHGPFREAWQFAAGICRREMNAVTDNPILFPDSGDVVSGGNFHGAYPGLACDVIKASAVDVMSMSERRMERMVNPHLSGLPAFLTREGGLHSGFMIVQVTAASLVNEAKTLAFPGTCDSIPTSAGQEDHVSMGTTAARHLMEVTQLFTEAAACETLAAAQALDMRRPLKGAPLVEAVYGAIRERVPMVEKDCEMAPLLKQVVNLLDEGGICDALKSAGLDLAAAEANQDGGLKDE